MNKKLIYLLFFVLLTYSCKDKCLKIEIKQFPVQIDTIGFITIADTLIDDMVVKNPDTTNWWTEKCLQRLQRKTFVDTIFAKLYRKEIIAYDYYTQQPLTINQIKKFEKQDDFNRNIVGKFQFYESWHYNSENHIFIKKVHAIIFGYETYTDKGEVKGYKPMFKIYFEQ